MQAIILAAGLGNRLGDLTKDRPKALVPVCGKELILRVMDFTDHPAITERVVVTGYESNKFSGFLKEHCPEVKIAHNENYREGNILTMEAALPFIQDEFILMNVDHIYPRRMFRHILENRNGVMAICDFDRTLGTDDMKVKLDENKQLCQIEKTLDDFDCGYIGMTYCSADSIDDYRKSFDSVLSDSGSKACVEDVLGAMAKNSMGVDVCDASGMPWLEVDTKEDLERAESALRGSEDFLS